MLQKQVLQLTLKRRTLLTVLLNASKCSLKNTQCFLQMFILHRSYSGLSTQKNCKGQHILHLCPFSLLIVHFKSCITFMDSSIWPAGATETMTVTRFLFFTPFLLSLLLSFRNHDHPVTFLHLSQSHAAKHQAIPEKYFKATTTTIPSSLGQSAL